MWVLKKVRVTARLGGSRQCSVAVLKTKLVKAQIITLVLLAFCSYYALSSNDEPVTIICASKLVAQSDTLKTMEKIKPNEELSQKVKSWHHERFVTLDDSISHTKDKALYILNRKKVEIECLNKINPEQMKSIKIYKNDDVPRYYKKENITILIKVKTYK